MPSTRVVIAVAAILPLLACQPSNEAPPAEEAVETPTEATDEEELEAVGDEFKRAWAAGDAQALGELYTADADFIDPTGTLFQGREAIVTRYRDLFGGMFQGTNISVDQASFRMLNEGVAVVHGSYEITGMRSAETDDTSTMEGRYTNVAVLENGDWKIESSRSMVPVEAPTESP